MQVSYGVARPAAQPASELIGREPHRDFRKPTHRAHSSHAASRPMAGDVRVVLGAKLFERGIQRVHAIIQSSRAFGLPRLLLPRPAFRTPPG